MDIGQQKGRALLHLEMRLVNYNEPQTGLSELDMTAEYTDQVLTTMSLVPLLVRNTPVAIVSILYCLITDGIISRT